MSQIYRIKKAACFVSFLSAMICMGNDRAEAFGAAILSPTLAYVEFAESGEAIVNPLMGYMGWAAGMTEKNSTEADVSLGFALLYWSEFEPQKGVYDFEAFEARNNIPYLRSRNIKLIIRPVCDYPELYKHMDIPQWLYDETGGAGAFYDHAGILGFAPDYGNEYFIERHSLMIRALAERYDDPDTVAFVQLGSLGHWGEWHNAMLPDGSFPGEEITDIYAGHYLSAFKNVKLQMRRPGEITKSGGMGLYNDMIGHEAATSEWLEWIPEAGMEDFYIHAPSGGEFASTDSYKNYFGPKYKSVKKMLVDSHATFVGYVPPNVEENKENTDDLLKTLGYRFTAVNAAYTPEVSAGGEAYIEVTIKNSGIAPFYYQWPFYYFFFDADGNFIKSYKSGRDVRGILPGAQQKFADRIRVDLLPGEYTVKLGLVNPHTSFPEVRFANKETDGENLLSIGRIKFLTM